MPDYRRFRVPGGNYFFTVNLLERYPNDLLVRHVDILRSVVRRVREKRPFHATPRSYCRTTCMAYGPCRRATTISPIGGGSSNRSFPRHRRAPNGAPRCGLPVANEESGSGVFGKMPSAMTRTTRRTWTTAISIRSNMGLSLTWRDWPYTTFHRYVQSGIYPPDWANMPVVEGSFGERQ